MMERPVTDAESSTAGGVRPSGYASRLEELWYGTSGPFYDLMTWWCFLPLGGERACRRQFVEWFEVQPGQQALSLCCGTGTTERALARARPTARIIAIDLGTGQIATAKRKDPTGRVEYRLGNACDTGFPADTFDRVLITLALHEMPRSMRMTVLREAARVCRPTGRVVAVEHAPVANRLSRFARSLWWFTWLPGNPETATTRDLQQHGLAREMQEAGLRIVARHTTRPAWIEGLSGEPGHPGANLAD